MCGRERLPILGTEGGRPMTRSRRDLLKGGLLMTAGAFVGSAIAGAQTTPTPSAAPAAATTAAPERPPRLDPGLVHDFVVAGHFDLARTRELLEGHPALINA